MTFREDDVSWLFEFIRRRSGISLSQDSVYLLDSRLAPMVESLGLRDPGELVTLLRHPDAEVLRVQVLERMTTHETRFFRDQSPFDALGTRILPALARRAGNPDVRVWCAACSTGQEPYSVAMVVEESRPCLCGAAVKILATDFSGKAVRRASSGIFSPLEVTKGLSPERLSRHFERDGRHWRVCAGVRRPVEFRRHNLVLENAPSGGFDVILCRNVLIYFDQPTRESVLDMLLGALRPEGFLFLGSTEASAACGRLVRAADGSGGWYYRRVDAPPLDLAA